MTLNRVKLFAIVVLIFLLFAVMVFSAKPDGLIQATNEDVAETYKAKCSACHSPKADKFFDVGKTDEELSEIILKGKKGEKPPYMPGFEAKGMTPEQAKALTVYMRQLKSPSNTNTNANANAGTNE